LRLISVKAGRDLARNLPGPFALAGRPEEIAVAAGCIGVLLLVLIGDLLTPVQVALSALGLIPLLAAAWLLSDRLALAVGVVGLGQLVLTAALGDVSIPTAISEATAYVVLGLVVRLYAGSLAELLSRPGPVKRTEVTSGRTGVDTLTRREREVAALAAQGYTAREIGAQLHIGERTVETHVANVCSKLGLRAKVELVRSASRLGL
jgi:DNA-binding CsgD family transcriptional regulator